MMRHTTFLALSIALLLVSCNHFKYETFFFVSVHVPVTESEVVPSTMLMPVKDTNTGTLHYVRSLPMFSSGDINDIEMVEGKDGIHCQLKFFIDNIASAKVQEALHYHHGQKFCVLVDGFFVGMTEFEAVKDEPRAVLTTEALWNKAEAELIIDNVKHNYDLKGNRSRNKR